MPMKKETDSRACFSSQKDVIFVKKSEVKPSRTSSRVYAAAMKAFAIMKWIATLTAASIPGVSTIVYLPCALIQRHRAQSMTGKAKKDTQDSANTYLFFATPIIGNIVAVATVVFVLGIAAYTPFIRGKIKPGAPICP